MGITVLAFDFGTKSIGCAVGQSITGTAQALPAFKAQDGIPNWSAIENCLKEWKRVVRYLNVVVSDHLKRTRSMVFLLA